MKSLKDSILKNFKKSKLSDKDRDALKILGLKNDTNWSDIQKRFKILVKKYHPDKNQGSRNRRYRKYDKETNKFSEPKIVDRW